VELRLRPLRVPVVVARIEVHRADVEACLATFDRIRMIGGEPAEQAVRANEVLAIERDVRLVP